MLPSILPWLFYRQVDTKFLSAGAAGRENSLCAKEEAHYVPEALVHVLPEHAGRKAFLERIFLGCRSFGGDVADPEIPT